MTVWWLIVGMAAVFVAVILVLRAWPAPSGNGEPGGVVGAPNPVHRFEGDGLPSWHQHSLRGEHGGVHDNVVNDHGGSSAGSGADHGGGAGGGDGGRHGND